MSLRLKVKMQRPRKKKKQERPKSVLKQVVAVGLEVMQQVAVHHFDSVQLWWVGILSASSTNVPTLILRTSLRGRKVHDAREKNV